MRYLLTSAFLLGTGVQVRGKFRNDHWFSVGGCEEGLLEGCEAAGVNLTLVHDGQ